MRGKPVGDNFDCRRIRILRRERGEHSATVKPVGVERAKIGLHAGVAAGIASGDSETARR